MIPQPPMALFLGGNLLGRVISYGYETPWASGKFEPAETDAVRRMIEVCELSEEIENWPKSESADDARWQAALQARGITEADADRHLEGPWMIQTPDGTQHELPSPPVFDRQGFITWRW